ncbi:MAG: hypothetical protein NZM39_12300 [Bernardetiaceae bacterium]|nr:hypothetical protein [Bernardetiaceae bacterium]
MKPKHFQIKKEKENKHNPFKVGDRVKAPDPHGKHVFRFGIVTKVSGELVTIQFHCTHAGPDARKAVFIDGRWVKETVMETVHFSKVRYA